MRMGKFEIETDDLVYIPSDDTFLLAENLEIKEGQSVLEIGTGSGLVSMYASLLSDDVTATDINYNALELAEKNFKLNNINTIRLEFGDLFEPVKDEKFDVILFNTPYLPTDSDDIINNDLNYAFDGGLDGRKVIDRFINEVSNHLNDKGIVQIIQSSLSDNDRTLHMFDSNGFIAEIAASEKFFFEEIVLINAYKIWGKINFYDDNMSKNTTNTTSRPPLTKDLKSEDFRQYYFLKEELKDFCKNEGLKVNGSKNQLEERIIYYLDTGKSLDDSRDIENKNNYSKSKSNKSTTSKEIRLDSILGENFKCSEDKREFFENEIGKGFKFKVQFQKWLKANPNKTYQDAIKAYYEIQNSNEKTAIDKQFQYNQYIRDFFKDNEDKTLEDAIKCWNYKKSLKGHNRYENFDLDALN